MKIGIIKEGKTPPDKRVPLSPGQCAEIIKRYPEVEIFVQRSNIRCFKDELYAQSGATLTGNISHCDLIIGVKEVPKNMLIEGKAHLFFSHTAKMQPYNKGLLQEILKKEITLLDYEYFVDPKGRRLIGFGKYAGIVGAYNGLLTFGDRFGHFKLKPAYLCEDRKELNSQLNSISLPAMKIVLTGSGRVSKGAREILEFLVVKEVSAAQFLKETFSYPVFCNAKITDRFELKAGGSFRTNDYYDNPSLFKSILHEFTELADLLITGHAWSPEYPVLLSQNQLQDSKQKTKVIADITCDIADPIASTLRPCVIGDPYFFYDPISGVETDEPNVHSISVMSVDNLPCELPKDASEDFGAEFVKHILPEFLKEESEMLNRATIVKQGKLNKPFKYLKDFVSKVD